MPPCCTGETAQGKDKRETEERKVSITTLLEMVHRGLQNGKVPLAARQEDHWSVLRVAGYKLKLRGPSAMPARRGRFAAAAAAQSACGRQ